MSIHINPIYLTGVILAWFAIYHLAYALIAITRDRSLVCWSIGPLGISAVTLREPPISQVVAQLICAALAVAGTSYASLYLLTPPPIAGLEQTLSGQLVAMAIPVALLTLWRLLGIVRERRFPLWGEARVMASIQRSRASGALIVFTTLGRNFLRERFGATPGEFLRAARF
ncbi:MAG TPA: hypothetical protein VFU63_06185 [Ktedonobacterales bacterium]|nr:hypothetical protein [Ktedonobacterales bacterium]